MVTIEKEYFELMEYLPENKQKFFAEALRVRDEVEIGHWLKVIDKIKNKRTGMERR